CARVGDKSILPVTPLCKRGRRTHKIKKGRCWVFNRSFRFALRCGAAVSALAVATTAQAQDAPDDRSSGVEEIVVTAQFRAQNLQDTPLAITAVSGEMLEARNQTSLDQVADQAPSVTLKPQ